MQRPAQTMLPGIVFLLLAAVMLAGWAGRAPQAADLRNHLGIMVQVQEELANGDLYPRWIGDFNNGRGEPALVFYPPLFYLLGGLLGLGGLLDPLQAYTLALLAWAVLGAAGMYRLVREVAPPAAALAGAFLFTLMPYRYFELYAAGLHPAFAAGCLFPWALRALLRTRPDEEGRAAAGTGTRFLGWSMFFALIILTNLPFGLLLGLLAAAWVLVEAIRLRNWQYVLRFGLFSGAGLVLAAGFLVPAVLEMPLVRIPFAGQALYASNFVLQNQGSWMEPALRSVFARMLLFPAGLCAAAGLALYLRFRQPSAGGERPASPPAGWSLLMLVITVCPVFLALPLSAPVWKYLPLLQQVNIPWRWLDPLSVPAAALGGILLAGFRPGGMHRRGLLLLAPVLLLAILCGALAASVAGMNGFEPAGRLLAELPLIRRMDGNFPPRTTPEAMKEVNVPLINARGGVIQGRVLRWNGTVRELEVQASQAATLILRTSWYPGWSASRVENGRQFPLPAGADPETGLVSIPVPAGQSRVRVVFGSTILRSSCVILSLLAWTALLGWRLLAWWKGRAGLAGPAA